MTAELLLGRVEIYGDMPLAAGLAAEQRMPAHAPDGLTMAVLTPMSRPKPSSSGPPELPGLIGAVVWMTPLIGRPPGDSISRLSALT